MAAALATRRQTPTGRGSAAHPCQALLDQPLHHDAALLHHVARHRLLAPLGHEDRAHARAQHPVELVAHRLMRRVAPLLRHVNAHVRDDDVVDLVERQPARPLERALADVVHLEAEAERLGVRAPGGLDVCVDQLDALHPR
eukprot:CAMPEP_0184393338 /NCGR_PEP_ID=MMETSP0007-20130409/34660_1 /TAXON_ID=97485 /ORGANISM="Prymnesium parvum, Strain Texoma1" /LENGTH=140 /DNA_ID=CAMNT_0026744299 /DNA_START=404 /DNA_END=823 /DNA_ORIENTATION=+